jgi:hypothetical protein
MTASGERLLTGCRGLIDSLAVSDEAPAHDSGPGTGPEDIKIITLARSARARAGAAEGAAVRDETGRTYAAATVTLPSLSISALRLAVAMAASSGAASLEAAAVVGEAAAPDQADLAALRDLGRAATLTAGRLRSIRTSLVFFIDRSFRTQPTSTF